MHEELKARWLAIHIADSRRIAQDRRSSGVCPFAASLYGSAALWCLKDCNYGVVPNPEHFLRFLLWTLSIRAQLRPVDAGLKEAERSALLVSMPGGLFSCQQSAFGGIFPTLLFIGRAKFMLMTFQRPDLAALYHNASNAAGSSNTTQHS